MTQMADRSQTTTGLSVYVSGGLHKVLPLPATVLLAKTNSVMFLFIRDAVPYLFILKQETHDIEGFKDRPYIAAHNSCV